MGPANSAVTSYYGQDKNEIRLIKQGLYSVDKLIRRRRHGAVRIHGDALRSDGPEVQPDRSRTGSAVEGKGQRSLAATTRVVQRVGHEKYARFSFALAIFERHHADRGRVTKGL